MTGSLPDVCIIPDMGYVVDTRPQSRAVEGSSVMIQCESGFQYGGSSVYTVICGAANFPASCRS